MIDTEALKWVRDLGFPIVALYYLFKLYRENITRTISIADNYAQITQDTAVAITQLTVAIQNLSMRAREDSSMLQAFMAQVMHVAIERNSQFVQDLDYLSKQIVDVKHQLNMKDKSETP